MTWGACAKGGFACTCGCIRGRWRYMHNIRFAVMIGRAIDRERPVMILAPGAFPAGVR